MPEPAPNPKPNGVKKTNKTHIWDTEYHSNRQIGDERKIRLELILHDITDLIVW